MPTSHDPSRMSPDERRRELATILAGGVVRLQQLRALSGDRAESQAERLDVPVGTVLSVRNGLTAGEAK